jgi:hypothetical protein
MPWTIHIDLPVVICLNIQLMIFVYKQGLNVGSRLFPKKKGIFFYSVVAQRSTNEKIGPISSYILFRVIKSWKVHYKLSMCDHVVHYMFQMKRKEKAYTWIMHCCIIRIYRQIWFIFLRYRLTFLLDLLVDSKRKIIGININYYFFLQITNITWIQRLSIWFWVCLVSSSSSSNVSYHTYYIYWTQSPKILVSFYSIWVLFMKFFPQFLFCVLRQWTDFL